jgi:hypothetical protein
MIRKRLLLRRQKGLTSRPAAAWRLTFRLGANARRLAPGASELLEVKREHLL